jgi:hypothetical protein
VSPCSRSRNAFQTLARVGGDHLNSVAILENAGWRYAKGGAKDACQVGRIGEACCVSCLGERSTVDAGEHGGQQTLPA